MRNSLVTSLALAAGALLFSTAAMAIPIKVGLTAAAGYQQWTSPPFGDPSHLTLSGWQWDDTTQAWNPAWMTSDEDGSGNPGLGICAVKPDIDNVCTNNDETNQIDSGPLQLLDMDISDLHSGWTQVSFTLLSFDRTSDHLIATGTNCSIADENAGNCQASQVSLPVLSDCTGSQRTFTYTCSFTRQYLDGLFAGTGTTDIWIQSRSQSCVGNCVNESFLFGSGLDHGFVMDGIPAPVPEPAAFGMFGFGVLLLGLFVGLGRHRRRGN